jgi:small subunit ribosomal protein S6
MNENVKLKIERHIMALYEHIYMARQDLSASQIEELTASYTKIIEENGGKVTKNEYWGLKPLAYRVNKNRKAHYILLNIDTPHAAIAEVERQMLINEDVLRFMTVSVEEHDSEPSVMMQKREDRPDRGGDRFNRGPKRF